MKDELDELYRLYAKELYFYAFSLTKNKSDAESLVSDAFFQLALQDPLPSQIKYWLFRVIKNRFIDQTRFCKRWFWQPIEKTKTKDIETPESIYLKNEKYQFLYLAIEQLDFPYKEVILFFYFLNWSTKEIADCLQFTTGQVRTMLYRGRKQLKEVIPHDRII